MRRFLQLLAVICLACGAFLAWFVPLAWLDRPVLNAPTHEVSITDGWSSTQIAFVLQQDGVVGSAFGYRLYANLDGASRRAKPGIYELQAGDSYQDIVHALALGPPRPQLNVLVVEGWDLRDISKTLQQDGVDPLLFAQSAGGPADSAPMDPKWREQYPFLKDLPADASLEGYLFPDTYRVYKDELPDALITKQLDIFGERAPQLESEAAAQGHTLNQIVTLASIVEKEVSNSTDRKIVAGIFWNRLKLGIPLQSDATVNYITQTGRTRSTAADLSSVSPYNTYKYAGLPPGPVDNPSDDALDAVLHPTKTDYLYFLTDANGKTYYAKTLDEHIQNRITAFGQ